MDGPTTHETGLFSLDSPYEERTATFDTLFFSLRKKWQLPFWLMLSLSAGIASLGLSANSAATVIGAMIVAPLGQSIVALGGSVALGWPRETARIPAERQRLIDALQRATGLQVTLVAASATP